MEVVKYTPTEGTGALKARFDLKIPQWSNLILPGWTYFQKDGKRWINLPSTEREKDGEKKYYWNCYFEDKQVNEAFRKGAMKALDEYIASNAHKGSLSPIEDQDDGLPF